MEHLSFENIKSAVELLSVLGAIGLGMLILKLRQTFVTKDSFHSYREKHEGEHAKHEDEHNRIWQMHEDTQKRLDEGSRQFAIIQADIKHLPNHHDISGLNDRIGGIEGSVKALSATINGLRDVLERVERPLNVLVDRSIHGVRQ
jgi:hypothetical protein